MKKKKPVAALYRLENLWSVVVSETCVVWDEIHVLADSAESAINLAVLHFAQHHGVMSTEFRSCTTTAAEQISAEYWVHRVDAAPLPLTVTAAPIYALDVCRG